MSYTTNTFPTDYIPTIFDNYVGTINVNQHTYELELVDTAGQEDYDSLRPLSYQHTDVFLVCFSVVLPISFQNIKARWISELKHFCPGIPYVLVGTQIDLRDDPLIMRRPRDNNLTPISTEEGAEMAELIKAVCYVECSAKTQERLHGVFEKAVLAALTPPVCRQVSKKKKGCIVS